MTTPPATGLPTQVEDRQQAVLLRRRTAEPANVDAAREMRKNQDSPSSYTSIMACAPGARQNTNVVVRFGLTGLGVCPNYQVEAPSHRVWPIHCDNHELDSRAKGERYAAHELSEERYTMEGVQGLLQRSLADEVSVSG